MSLAHSLFITLKPLGIEEATWESCPRGINTGGFGLSIKTEDIAKFGQLYLQKGAGCSPCYNFWNWRYEACYGPYLGIALPGISMTQLTENSAAYKRLQDKLTNLSLPLQPGQYYKTIADKVSGKNFKLANNDLNIDSVSFDFEEDSCIFTTQLSNRKETIKCGFGEYIAGVANFTNIPSLVKTCAIFNGIPSHIMTCANWSAQDTFIILMRLVETPFSYILESKFNDDFIEINIHLNVSFSTTHFPALKGWLEN